MQDPSYGPSCKGEQTNIPATSSFTRAVPSISVGHVYTGSSAGHWWYGARVTGPVSSTSILTSPCLLQAFDGHNPSCRGISCFVAR